MLQALTTPVFKSVVLGGVLLGSGIGAKVMTSKCDQGQTRRLVLHAPVERNAIYLSAWDDGDVRIKYDGELRPMTFEIRASVSDGCRWLGVETLEPIDDKTYAYDYSEYILECDEGATPFLKTPRTGIVDVLED
jgi:hypothetical protein